MDFLRATDDQEILTFSPVILKTFGLKFCIMSNEGIPACSNG